MSDLIVLIPNHGYSEDDTVYVSWLGDIYYVDDPDQNSFKLTDGADGANIQYTETITDGYVRIDTGSGTTSITGLGHLEGELVYVVSGGEVVGYGTVSGGAITITETVTTYSVGKAYAASLKTMRFSIPGAENLQHVTKRISESVVRYVKTKNMQIGQQSSDTNYLTDVETDYETVSRDISVLTKGGFSKDGYTIIKSIEPYPMTILATIVEVEVWER
jgi:hypothetical protein